MDIETGRVRDHDGGGHRVLVDRLWPRGLAKAEAEVELWAKDLAPSTELRRWYHADREARHDEFVDRYRAELDAADHGELVDQLQALGDVVLLTDTKDVAASHVPVLADWLRG